MNYIAIGLIMTAIGIVIEYSRLRVPVLTFAYVFLSIGLLLNALHRSAGEEPAVIVGDGGWYSNWLELIVMLAGYFTGSLIARAFWKEETRETQDV